MGEIFSAPSSKEPAKNRKRATPAVIQVSIPVLGDSFNVPLRLLAGITVTLGLDVGNGVAELDALGVLVGLGVADGLGLVVGGKVPALVQEQEILAGQAVARHTPV